MKAKVVSGVLLSVACLCFITVYGISQTEIPPTPSPSSPPPSDPVSVAPSPVPAPPVPGAPPVESVAPALSSALPPQVMPEPAKANDLNLEQLAQQLRNVRLQQKSLAAQEVELLKRVDMKVEEQRKALQKAEELRKQLRQEKAPEEKKRDSN
jgi:hypothetical protein